MAERGVVRGAPLPAQPSIPPADQTTTPREGAHTPGLWVTEYGSEVIWIGVPKAASRTGLFEIVASVEGGVVHAPAFLERAKANARLIAAAPQLLDSLLAVEWAGTDEDKIGDLVDSCPNCGMAASDPERVGSGLHTPTCELRDSLDAALGVKSPRAEVSRG